MYKNDTKIPKVSFYKKKESHIEFDIVQIEDLSSKNLLEDIQKHHSMDFNAIIIIAEGNGTHDVNFKSFNYTDGTIFFIARHQIHKFNLNENTKGYILVFTDNFFNRLLKNNVKDIFDFMRFSTKLELKEQITNIYQNLNLLLEEMQKPLDLYKEPILLSHMYSLLLKFKRHREKQKPILNAKDEVIYQTFKNMVYKSHNYKKQVNEYAKKLNISSKKLTNLLNKYTGKSTKIYLDEFLLLQIKKYLIDDALSLDKISQKLKFDEATNLIKFFKRLEGTTPSKFKQQQKMG